MTENGVTIIGYTDFPSRMAAQASTLYATNIRHMMADLTPEKDGQVNHDMEDDVIRGATVTFEGEITYPPPPPKVAAIAAQPKAEVKEKTPEELRAEEAAAFKAQTKQQVTLLAVGGALMLGVGLVAPASFMQHFIVFVLAVFVGFQVIWNVSHSLHTPLMAGDQCDLFDHHSGGADADRLKLGFGDYPCGCFGLYGRDQHLWRLPRDTAYARHVPEILRSRDQWNSVSLQRLTWSQPFSSSYPWVV